MTGEASSEDEEKKVFVTIKYKDEQIVLEYPEPNLDTLVYDTGLMTLTPDSGAQYASDSTNIFDSTLGAQKARVIFLY